jgi:hypothetical protein
MSKPTFRALCAELTEYVSLLDEPPHELVIRALAALDAQPEPVALTDEELDDWHSQCADLTRRGAADHYWAFDLQGDEVAGVVRAALVRWGCPTP